MYIVTEPQQFATDKLPKATDDAKKKRLESVGKKNQKKKKKNTRERESAVTNPYADRHLKVLNNEQGLRFSQTFFVWGFWVEYVCTVCVQHHMGHKFCGQVGNFIEMINRKKSTIFYGFFTNCNLFSSFFSGMSLEFVTKIRLYR